MFVVIIHFVYAGVSCDNGGGGHDDSNDVIGVDVYERWRPDLYSD